MFCFAGEVMTSFNHVVIPTRSNHGNWFQTNSLENEHDEPDSCVHLLQVLKMTDFFAVPPHPLAPPRAEAEADVCSQAVLHKKWSKK